MEEKKIGQKFYRVWKDSWRCLGEVYKITDKKGGYYTVVDRKGNFHTFSIQDPSLIANKKDAVSLFYRLENEIKLDNKYNEAIRHSIPKDNADVFSASLKTRRTPSSIGKDLTEENYGNKKYSSFYRVGAGDTVLVRIDGCVESYKILHATGVHVPVSTYRDSGEVKIVSEFVLDDNKNVEKGEIYEVAPLAKAMIGKKVGDSFRYEIDGYSHYGGILKIKKGR